MILRVRIALVRSSILTQGRHIGIELFEACVRDGIISPALAEVIARQQRSEFDQVKYLAVQADLSNTASKYLLGVAAEIAQKIRDAGSYTNALIEVASRLEGEQRLSLFRQALEGIERVRPFPDFSLIALAQRLGNSDREVLARVLAAAPRYGPYCHREVILTVLRSSRTADPHLFRLALGLAEQSGREVDRAEAISQLSQLIPGDAHQQELIMLALNAARRLREDWPRVIALLGILGRLSGSERIEVLSEALTAAKRIDFISSRVEALSRIAAFLSGSERMGVLKEALAAIRHGESTFGYTIRSVLQALNRADPPEIVQEALEIVRRENLNSSRAQALAMFGGLLTDTARLNVLHDALKAAFESRYDRFAFGWTANVVTIANDFEVDDRRRILTETLEAAREIDDRDSQASALINIGKYLDAASKSIIMSAAKTIVYEIGKHFDRLKRLGELSESFPADSRKIMMRDALLRAKRLSDPADRAEALSFLADRVKATERERILIAAVAAARELSDNPEHSGRRIDDAWIAIAEAAHSTDEAILQSVLETASRVGYAPTRVRMELAAIKTLPTEDRQSYIQRALDTARDPEHSIYSVDILCRTSDWLASPARENVLDEAVIAARRKSPSWSTLHELCLVARKLTGQKRRDLLREVLLGISDDVEMPVRSARKLADSLGQGDTDIVSDLLHKVASWNDGDRGIVSASLVKWLPDLSPSNQEAMRWLDTLSRADRWSLIRFLGDALPGLNLLSRPQIAEMARAIIDCGESWS